jgi:hypothetical protein
MKKIAIVVALLLSPPAFAEAGKFHADLVGYNEVPSVNTKAHASFSAKVASDWLSVEYELTYEGLQAPIQQAHIHFSQTRVNGPIIVWLCGTTALPGPAGTATCPGATSGTVKGTFTSAAVLAAPGTQQLSAGDIGAIVLAMENGAAYANIHTTVSPGGEIRGQISN